MARCRIHFCLLTVSFQHKFTYIQTASDVMPQGEVMWQLGDIHEKLGNHGKAGSVGFVSRPPWLEENHGLIGICLRSVDQFDPCNESSCCILVGVWPIRRNVSIDVTMYVYISIGLYTPNHPLEHLLQCWLPKECGTYDMGHALKEKNVGRMNHTAGMIFWVSLCLHFFWCCLGSIATLLSCFFCKYSLRMFTYGIFFPIFHQSSLVNSLQRVGFFSEPPQPKPMIFPFGRRMNGFHFW